MGKLLGILVFAVLVGCTTPAPAQLNNGLFEQFEIVTGTAKRQTVIPGFFLGGATAKLAVVHIDERGDRRLHIYGFDGAAWVPVLDATLRPGVLFVDVANIGERDRLITYEHGRFNWFDTDSATERALVEIATHYNATDEGEVPHLDITRDVNDDGRDDLLVPDIDGFWVSIQMSDGSFTDAVKLGPAEPFLDSAGLVDSGIDESRSYGEVGLTAFTLPLYLSRIHEMDYNQDGLDDLVFWNEDHFDVYCQTERGLFDPVAKTFTTNVAFDADGIYSHAFEFSDTGVFALLFGLGKNVERTVLHSLRDMNGDDVPDLVTLTLAGRSPFKQRSVYEVHFGAFTADGILFSQDVSTAIHPRGKAGGGQPWGYASRRFEDFDGDGQVDIMLRDINIGLGGMIRAITTKSVRVDLEFFRMNGGVYPDKPNFTRKIRTDVASNGGNGPFLPAVLLGDVNGDGRADLLAGGGSREELDVFIGVSGPDVFARRPYKLAVAMPQDGEYVSLVDLNEDGKQDILMHHAPNDHAPTEPHRLTILIAR